MRQGIAIVLVVTTVIVLAGLTGFVAWGLTPLGPNPGSPGCTGILCG